VPTETVTISKEVCPKCGADEFYLDSDAVNYVVTCRQCLKSIMVVGRKDAYIPS
jgi:predicted nucleic-acid-binding Zn-ribbon protein